MPLQAIQLLSSPQRSKKTNYQLGALLSFVAGAINAGGYLAVDQYTSHMSGIISAIGDDLALGNIMPVIVGAVLLCSFIGGAATTALLVNWGKRRQIRSQYALPLLLEAFVLLLFGLLGSYLSTFIQLTIPIIVFLLCFVMGLQNAIVTKMSNSEIRTTHMTGVATDIGIEIGRMLYWNRSKLANKYHFVQFNNQKLKLHLLILGMFMIGVLIGAIAFKKVGFISVLPISITLIVISLSQIYRDLKRVILKTP
jgi:uncharacterized membrane protein YoaK (UPF0700 family)